MLHRFFPSKVALIIISIITLCGIVPCVISGFIWVFALAIGFTGLSKGDIFHFLTFMFLAWGGAGAAGLCFFIAALRAYLKQQPWKGWYYALGLWGLFGALPFVYWLLKDLLYYNNITNPSYDLILLCCAPIYALFVAWYYRPRASL
ncbi:MAG: hypothetical protein EAY65_03740 [Alphaproteobacteria bacterium]|nr:MAG: hypothetical protein EAY65_03740 [Alphaproteobacteria bacterium]